MKQQIPVIGLMSLTRIHWKMFKKMPNPLLKSPKLSLCGLPQILLLTCPQKLEGLPSVSVADSKVAKSAKVHGMEQNVNWKIVKNPH